jgi:uncharacterized protein (TIGR03000 family)
MYSAVLMLALTAGSETADFGKSRCSGCYSSCSTSCSVVYTGCSSCSTRHGLFSGRCHGCSSSCSTSCSSSCHGGLFNRRSCHCTPVCSGCTVYTCSGCTGVIVTPPPPVKKEMPKGEKIDAPKKDTTATIIINLPADARLMVDGNATTSTTEVRTLVTPELVEGATYVYTVQAQVTREGRVMTQTQEVTVRGGETSNVLFNFSANSVASR